MSLYHISAEKSRGFAKMLETAKQDSRFEGMGTTLVVATVIERTLYVANVGDSRLYLLNDEIKQVTKDHSLVQEMVRLGGIKQEDAKNHPDKNIITRAIGAKEDVEVDFYEYRLKQIIADRFCVWNFPILCTCLRKN